MSLFACRWLPGKKRNKDARPPKALVFLCHGYAVECGVTMRGTGERLARAGYAVYGLDYEGHGRSDGLQGYVPDFEALVQDCDDHFASVVRSHGTTVRHRFLLGESMGGAVALLLHRARPDFWTGAVLVAPMCKIADDMRPHPVVVSILRAMNSTYPPGRSCPPTTSLTPPTGRRRRGTRSGATPTATRTSRASRPRSSCSRSAWTWRQTSCTRCRCRS
ncbi:hypothetical protein SEVIR_8G000950v4 [Setaria viridis]|uniref:Serine aminopeptidase S33 domain-containing protein n=1 Tax=Setaria viridis TaxID=4556 RepID=A0A4U6TA29_SETVI|nr:hypothetical protein SEVIR_8G000950v2 [Setaria viridis]